MIWKPDLIRFASTIVLAAPEPRPAAGAPAATIHGFTAPPLQCPRASGSGAAYRIRRPPGAPRLADHGTVSGGLRDRLRRVTQGPGAGEDGRVSGDLRVRV